MNRIEPIELSIDTTIQVGLIINELVSNALKYAFPNNENGIISLTLSKENDRYVLEVSDNGVGIRSPEDLLSSYGYRIIRAVSQGLNGEISIQHDQGTTFRLTFP